MALDASGTLSWANALCSPDRALTYLAPPVRLWFEQMFGVPTPPQRLAWPAVARGENLLLSSPTGSGKTLAALGPILSELCLDTQPGVRCLHVTPLKALGNDLRKNLRKYLQGIHSFMPPDLPRPRVAVRTGDTGWRVRQKILHEPPEILITTPESLAVMLAQAGASEFFRSVGWVIVDEIHSLAGSKRGADLALSLERLENMVADRRLRRLALSASVSPLERAAQFLVGVGRQCTMAEIPDRPSLQVRIELLSPPPPENQTAPQSFLHRLVDRLTLELVARRTVLIFTNSKNLAERLTWALRRKHANWADTIAVHHAALAPACRRLVERRLKHGRLRAVVTSTSLELGIDIGSVDEVVLIHPPGDVVRLLQRLGRSGHYPGGRRRGLVLAAGPSELLEAAVTVASCDPVQIEPLRVPNHPLDVLCQHLLGLGMHGWCNPDDAYRLVCRAYPYRDLPRADFNACLHYLSGRDCDGSTWLPPRFRWEEGCFTIAEERTRRLVRRNLGTILTEDGRAVRLNDEPAVSQETFARHPRLGEVDELFADQLQPGDRFLLDGRCLEYQRQERSSLLVTEVAGRPRAPRWPGSGWPISRELAQRVYGLRVQAAEALRDGEKILAAFLHEQYGLGPDAIDALSQYFALQETLSEVPDESVCLIECVATEVGMDYYIHVPLHRAATDALARIVCLRIERDYHGRALALAADLGLLVSVSHCREISPDEWRRLLSLNGFADDLERALRNSQAVRERFRRTAHVGLMLLRNPLGKKRRVGGRSWAERRLYDQVLAHDADFVLLAQALRDLREEICDEKSAVAYVQEIARRPLRCRHLPCASPFAESWTQMTVSSFEALRPHDVPTP
jgi:ATP-dependent Lhr-like helicase